MNFSRPAFYALTSPYSTWTRELRTVDEFAELWERHEVGVRWSSAKRFDHPEVGRLDLYCQTLLDPDQGQSLLILTATPGSESHDKLALLTVLGAERFAQA